MRQLKKNYFFLLGIIVSLLIYYNVPKNSNVSKKFVFIITSYQNAPWYQKNLDSILSQTYPHYRIIYVDDNSPDHTAKLVSEYAHQHNITDKITIIKNQERLGACYNRYQAIWQCKDDEIAIILDGDDWLARSDVLQILNTIYSNNNIWLTYGQYVRYPAYAPGFCRPLSNASQCRQLPWVTSHLRSFYTKLYKQINPRDLQYESKFLPMTSDLAEMFPMLEMATNRHICFIPIVLYVYNFQTPHNDIKVNSSLQLQLDAYLRQQAPYAPLSQLFT